MLRRVYDQALISTPMMAENLRKLFRTREAACPPQALEVSPRPSGASLDRTGRIGTLGQLRRSPREAPRWRLCP
jgi:hypothetical protein